MAILSFRYVRARHAFESALFPRHVVAMTGDVLPKEIPKRDLVLLVMAAHRGLSVCGARADAAIRWN